MHAALSFDSPYDILERLRVARRDFHSAVTSTPGTRERVFEAPQFLRTLRDHIERSGVGSPRERASKLFGLTVLLYGALDWHFAGHGVDIEADVQLERIRQNQLHGGPDMDDRLSAEAWTERLRAQLVRLEGHLVSAEDYALRLIKQTALAQAALEAICRRTPIDAGGRVAPLRVAALPAVP